MVSLEQRRRSFRDQKHEVPGNGRRRHQPRRDYIPRNNDSRRRPIQHVHRHLVPLRGLYLRPGQDVDHGERDTQRPGPARMHLDFNEITVDGHGRVEAAYTDGCTATCETTNAVNATGCGTSEMASYTSTAPCTTGRLSAGVRKRRA